MAVLQTVVYVGNVCQLQRGGEQTRLFNIIGGHAVILGGGGDIPTAPVPAVGLLLLGRYRLHIDRYPMRVTRVHGEHCSLGYPPFGALRSQLSRQNGGSCVSCPIAVSLIIPRKCGSLVYLGVGKGGGGGSSCRCRSAITQQYSGGNIQHATLT